MNSDPKPDLVDRLRAYDASELSETETIEFFQYLIDTGLVGSLPPHYSRVAQILLSNGKIRQNTV